ncbi:MAG: hypothetical protein WC845_02520 [Candidatus Staskawiczbacteria bacterium]|jgi:hypothetical protein
MDVYVEKFFLFERESRMRYETKAGLLALLGMMIIGAYMLQIHCEQQAATTQPVEEIIIPATQPAGESVTPVKVRPKMLHEFN